ncbi:hypothetical protein SDC9_186079 [bioreactor metagenome]|uniref:Uncharacterized protein n=1 Tax=bioreactor metagenome TaxID=1076179 RepID=A0A645HHP2_9ZZZZ
MKTFGKLIFLLLIATGIYSCKCNKMVEKTQPDQAVKVIKAGPGEETIAAVIPYTVDTVWVENLSLHADISYTGEKTDVEFSLVFNGMWLKSMPPKANLVIVSDVASAQGKKTVKQHLVFDLTPLASGNTVFEVYVKGYKQGLRIGEE